MTKYLIMVLILCTAAVSGCARAGKVAVGAGKVAGVEARAAQAANKGRALVMAHTSALTPDERWTVVHAACTANDLLDLWQAPDFASAVEQAWITFGGYRTLYYRILGLAEDLRYESTEWERRQRLGVFVVCESS